MIIGIPKEIKNKENRVSLITSGVKAFQDAGHQVLVQKDAGLGAGISNEAYKTAGASIVEKAEEIYERADMIIKVKEPLPEEYPLLRENQILYTFLHLAPEERLTKALLTRKIIGIAYETIQTEDKCLPILTPMSAVAGRMAVQLGASFLQHERGGKGLLLGGVTGVQPGRVVILGAGVVGLEATKMAVGLGAQVTVLDINLKRLDYLSDIFGNKITTLYSTYENIENCCIQADLLISGVLVTGAKAPKLVTREMIGRMEAGSVIIDVAVDQGGAVETSKATSHEHPTYLVDGILHYAVPNMPGAVPKTSTYALANTTLKYGLKIANLGWEKALKQDLALQKGLNLAHGKITYAPVAEAHGLPYEEIRL